MNKLHWLSFADGGLPRGSQFLGVAIVSADDFLGGIKSAWDMGINPGGQVMGLEIPEDNARRVPDEYKSRLLTRSECEALDVILDGAEH